jgi:uncharacterized protein YjbI with pentapeptide repeats
MANRQHISLLKQGISIWNEWRENNQNILPNLQEANLGNMDLRDADFSNLNLAKTNFYKSDLNNIDLRNANLENANFCGANLNGANFEGAKIDYAIFKQTIITPTTILEKKGRLVAEILDRETITTDLREINLSKTNLFRANLSGLDLSKANLNGANLSEANLSKTELREIDLSNANLYLANLSDAYLFKANLQQANLNFANLDGAYLREANLNYASFKETQLSQRTILEEKWRIVWEIINDRVIDNNFDRLDLSKAYFVGIDFQEANLKNANLRNANLCAANLSKVRLDKADLQGAFYNFYTQFPANFDPKKANAIERMNEYLSDKTLLLVSQGDDTQDTSIGDRFNSPTESDRTNFLKFRLGVSTPPDCTIIKGLAEEVTSPEKTSRFRTASKAIETIFLRLKNFLLRKKQPTARSPLE